MKQYYLMAIDKGCTSSMLCLAMYYCNTEQNYDFFLTFKKNINLNNITKK